MIRFSRLAAALSGVLSAVAASGAAVQAGVAAGGAAEPTSATPLPPIAVDARPIASPTSLSSAALKRRLDQTAGSVGFVDASSYLNTYAFTLRDVLQNAPGVFVENRYGQELRLSIRGSGIARGYHARGLDILQDGIPTNLADGSGDYYQIDPLALQATEIYKGGNGLQYGASTLGGAINFVTPTAHTAEAPNLVRVEGGSDGTLRTGAQLSRVIGPLDFLATFSVNHAHGWRDHERGRYQQFNANLGYRFSPSVETRFYVGAYLVDQQLPGSLSLFDALHRPAAASPGALSGDQARNSRTERIANRTTLELSGGELQFDTWAIHKSLYHPIFQVIDQDGWTYGFAPRFTAHPVAAGMRDDLMVGARFFGGRTGASQFVNVHGERGAQTLDARQSAFNYEAYLENRLFFLPTVALMTGVKVLHSVREYIDYGGLPGDAAYRSTRASYSGLNPKLGLLWRPAREIQAFADITRSQDVPDFTDLSQTFAATTRFTPLAAQHAWTLELGTRGTRDRLSWDLTAYRSLVRDQLLQYTTDPAIPAATFNANKTVLQGIEAGASIELWRDLTRRGAGDRITLSGLWNVSDFRFQDDPQYGSKRIAGVPLHVLRGVLGYARPNGFHVSASLDWVPSGAWADDANTLRVPGYTVFGMQAGMDFRNGLSIYIDLRNLANKRYVSDISTVANARTASSTAIFYPGAGRSLFAGMRCAF
ncbi:TonB-dependent receptor family protein [Burkholderia glumae]|uniref:TonB-dependent receptor family protein n=1 Tax=Burkholderia glumae TaxID=337 RepID=UPI000C270880|nr:TonB-dependent receptor [Burkholderia glumae]PJO20942.1 TonB-dependent receptor [Burkholderia glumae AU6208]QHE12749.1 TonB-dependent receptor [Burkholderia glumae AU6208]